MIFPYKPTFGGKSNWVIWGEKIVHPQNPVAKCVSPFKNVIENFVVQIPLTVFLFFPQKKNLKS